MNYYFIIIFATVTSGIDSRSLEPSSYDEEAHPTEVPNTLDDLTTRPSNNNDIVASLTNHNRKDQSSPLILSQGEKLEKLLTDLAINQGERNAMQWLKHLKFKTDQFPGENNSESKFPENLILSDVVESPTPSLQMLKTANDFQSHIDSAGELDIYYQEGQDDNGHVKSRHEDSSALFPLLRNEVLGFNHVDYGTAVETKNERNSTDELDVMLSELQGQVNRMRKYLDNDCRKHQKSSATNLINQSNKILTLQ